MAAGRAKLRQGYSMVLDQYTQLEINFKALTIKRLTMYICIRICIVVMQITYWILLIKKTLIQKRCIEGVSCYDFPSFFCYCYKYLIEILVRQRAFNIIEKTKTILSFSQVRKVLIYILADYLIRLKYVCYKVTKSS